MKRHYKIKNIILLATVVFLSVQFAQQDISAALLRGTIEDADGAIIKGASVSAQNLETGRIQTTTGDASGRYSFDNSSAGNYRLSISEKALMKRLEKFASALIIIAARWE